MLPFAATIFLSAFLLFQIQPIVAKQILPWFGGSATVWTTCMLFFQVGLLAGYGYAHWAVQRWAPRVQARIHGALLACAVALLPVVVDAGWKPQGRENPTVQIVVLLLATVGLPFFLLSTTGPLLQAWYARAAPGRTPYRLFALSNLGSMLALVTYPFQIEPILGTSMQAWVWSGGFCLFAVLCGLLAFANARRTPSGSAADSAAPARTESPDVPPPSLGRRAIWVALAACPSILMLAITSHLTQDVAPVPFLWVLPLGIYLLSFILTFDSDRWYIRDVFLVLLVPALGLMAYLQWTESTWALSAGQSVRLFSLGLFICCMVCHGELAAQRPPVRHLTGFYLMLSVGGALGGLFVGVVAPYGFQTNAELPIGLVLCGALAWLVRLDQPGRTWRQALTSPVSLLVATGLAALSVFLVRSTADAVTPYRLVSRNFYGVLKVKQNGNESDLYGFRTLMHGNIGHGAQWTNPAKRMDPITYYCADSGIARAVRRTAARGPFRMGVLGLGAGVLARFGRRGDEIRFFEINTAVDDIARSHFTYLTDAQAATSVVFGDARLSLERETQDAPYDILMMDAFSGDSIPTHLVTREAFELYFSRLAADGVLVMHITNRYLDLEPVVARLAAGLGKTARVFSSAFNPDIGCLNSRAVLLSNRPATLDEPAFAGAGTPARIEPGIATWTDDYSNLYQILRVDQE